MMVRPIRLPLVLVTLAGAAVAAVACGGSSGSGTTTPTPPPPFLPAACQITWVTNVPGAQFVEDVMVLDVPVGDWTVGTHSYAAGGARGIFYKHYDQGTGAFTAKAVEQTGSFTLTAATTTAGTFVHFVDGTAQELVLVDTAGNPVASEGTSGTGDYFGPLSDPFSQNLLHGSGSLTVVFDGTAEILGKDVSWSVCRPAGNPPP